MANKSKKKVVALTTRLGRTLQWVRDAFSGWVSWVKTTSLYQYLDEKWIDAPPVKATTLLGYCLALGLSLTVMFSASVVLIRKHDAKAMAEQHASAQKVAKRDLASLRDEYAICLIELDRVSNELAAVGMKPELFDLTAPAKAPRSKRSGGYAPKVKPEGYIGPRPW